MGSTPKFTGRNLFLGKQAGISLGGPIVHIDEMTNQIQGLADAEGLTVEVKDGGKSFAKSFFLLDAKEIRVIAILDPEKTGLTLEAIIGIRVEPGKISEKDLQYKPGFGSLDGSETLHG